MHCLQPDSWYMAIFEVMGVHLDAYESDEVYVLDDKSLADLRALLMNEAFAPMLTALDIDQDRVNERRRLHEQIDDFKEFRRDTSLRELNRWIDPDADFDIDDFVDYTNPKTCMSYSDWMKLITVSQTPSQQDSLKDVADRQTIIAKALVANISYTANLHYKLDHVFKKTQEGRATILPEVMFEEMKLKYPFLSGCDDHVALVPNTPPLALSRSAGVSFLSQPLSHSLRTINQPIYIIRTLSFPRTLASYL